MEIDSQANLQDLLVAGVRKAVEQKHLVETKGEDGNGSVYDLISKPPLPPSTDGSGSTPSKKKSSSSNGNKTKALKTVKSVRTNGIASTEQV